MAAQLQGGVEQNVFANIPTFEGVIQKNPDFYEWPQVDQVELANLFFAEKYSDYTPEEQTEIRTAFDEKYKLPSVTPSNVEIDAQSGFSRPQAEQPDFLQQVREGGFDDYKDMSRLEKWQQPGFWHQVAKEAAGFGLSTSAGALRGGTFGYLDPTEQVQQLNENMGVESFQPWIPEAIGDIGGAIGSGMAIDKLARAAMGGIQSAGRAALPYASELAAASGYPAQLARGVVNASTAAQQAAQRLAGPGIKAAVARLGLEGALYGGLYKADSNEERLANTAMGAAAGAGLGAGGAALTKGGKVLQGYVSKTGNELLDRVRYDAMPDISGKLSKRMGQAQKRVAKLVDNEYLSEKEAKQLQKLSGQIDEAVKRERTIKGLPKAEKLVGQLEKRAEFRAKAGKKVRPKEQPKPVETPKREALPAPKIEAETLKPQPQKKEVTPPKPLTGSVTEMVEQGLEDFGGSYDEAVKAVKVADDLGKVEEDDAIKALMKEREPYYNKRDDASKAARDKIDAKIRTIKDGRNALREKAGKLHPNLRAVISTGWDGKSPLATQHPVNDNQLKRDAIEGLVTDKKNLDKIDEAIKGGVSVRGEFTSEITGSTDEAAKITATGKVKVPLSTFTPTHYTTVKKHPASAMDEVESLLAERASLKKRDAETKALKEQIDTKVESLKQDYPAVVGYNEFGHKRLHYFDSPEGSTLDKIKVMKDEKFVGTVPNVYLGQRKYKVADVLKRPPDEAKGIKTSEALSNAQGYATLFSADTMKQFSKPTQKVLRQVQKRGWFDESTLKYILKQVQKNTEELAVVCNAFGLK